VIIMVEQYLHDALRLADTIYILRRGEIAFAGEPSELTASAT
jgi:branched-chain amino acid transport system ATP-binding protein